MLAQTDYGYWFPPLLSKDGHSIDQIIDIVHVFMAVLFVGWGIFFVQCLVKYRQKPGHQAEYNPIKAKPSKYVEIFVVLFEAAILLVFSMPVWAAYKNSPPAPDQRLEVRVVAEQFQWDFHYAGKDGVYGKTDAKLITASNPLGLIAIDHPDQDSTGVDDIVTINEFHLPVGKPMYVRLTSKDVIHSFDIPTMRVKQDAIPGMEIPIWFTVDPQAISDLLREKMTKRYPVDKASWYKLRHFIASVDHKGKGGEVVLAKGGDLGGSFDKGKEMLDALRKAGITELEMQPRTPLEVVCAQLCGNSHFKMKAQMVTHDEKGFEQWMIDQKKEVQFEEF